MITTCRWIGTRLLKAAHSAVALRRRSKTTLTRRGRQGPVFWLFFFSLGLLFSCSHQIFIKWLCFFFKMMKFFRMMSFSQFWIKKTGGHSQTTVPSFWLFFWPPISLHWHFLSINSEKKCLPKYTANVYRVLQVFLQNLQGKPYDNNKIFLQSVDITGFSLQIVQKKNLNHLVKPCKHLQCT